MLFAQLWWSSILSVGKGLGWLCRFFFFQAEDGIRDWSVTGVQTCALPIFAAVGCDDAPPEGSFDTWLADWRAGHADIHPWHEVRRELDARFAVRHEEWTPYLYDYRLDDALEPLERTLIESGALDANGVRYVAARRG